MIQMSPEVLASALGVEVALVIRLTPAEDDVATAAISAMAKALFHPSCA